MIFLLWKDWANDVVLPFGVGLTDNDSINSFVRGLWRVMGCFQFIAAEIAKGMGLGWAPPYQWIPFYLFFPEQLHILQVANRLVKVRALELLVLWKKKKKNSITIYTSIRIATVCFCLLLFLNIYFPTDFFMYLLFFCAIYKIASIFFYMILLCCLACMVF